MLVFVCGILALSLVRPLEGQTNQPPVVVAGPDQTIALPASATLSGTVSDDGLPSAKLSWYWTKVGGPGTVILANRYALNTTASFSIDGTYVLRLVASDGVLTRTDDIVITVKPPSITYYVDNTNPSANDNNPGTDPALPWRSIGKAARTLLAGQTVIVMASGSYDERVTPANSGMAGNVIAYKAGAGARPRVRGFTLTGKNYTTIDGFEITNTGFSADPNPAVFISSTNTGVQVLNNYIHHTASWAVRFGSSSFIRISGNSISYVAYPVQNIAAVEAMWGEPSSDVLVENNSISYAGDYFGTYGTRFVFRNNTLGPADPTNPAHIDVVQPQAPTTNSLIEGNLSIDNASSDNHFFWNEATGSNRWIVRHNSTLRSSGIVSLISTTNNYLYNNTFYRNNDYYHTNTQVGLQNNSINNVARNNIWYRSVTPWGSPYHVDAGSAIDKDYDLWFDSGSPQEPHGVYGDPKFVNADAGDFHLQAGSPAIGTGGSLTKVRANDTGSGTSLLVIDAGFFQDGWAGVSPDWIAIGSTSNVVQIRSIDTNTNTNTNTITLAAPIARKPGDPVWLYKNSSGMRVLDGAAPDIGAFEYITQ
jgi:hypothetical protein